MKRLEEGWAAPLAEELVRPPKLPAKVSLSRSVPVSVQPAPAPKD